MGILNLKVSRKLLLAAASMAFAVSAFCAPSLAFADGAADDLAAGAGIEKDALTAADGIAAEAAALPSDAGASAADAVEFATGDADAAIDEDTAVDQAGSDASGADAGIADENDDAVGAVEGDAADADGSAAEAVVGDADDGEGFAAEDASVSDAEDAADETADDASAAQGDGDQSAATPAVEDPAPVKENAAAGSVGGQAPKVESAAKPAASKSGAKGAGDVVLKPQAYTVVEIPKTVNRVYNDDVEEYYNYCPFGCCSHWDSDDTCEHNRAYYDKGASQGWYMLDEDGWVRSTEIGSYKVTVRLASGCIWSDGTTGDKTLTWRIDPRTVAIPKVKNYTYNGEYRCPFVGCLDPYENDSDWNYEGHYGHSWGFSNYDDMDCDWSAVRGIHKCDAGTYKVTVRLNDGRQWSDGTTGDKVLTWRIYPKKVSVPEVWKGTYDGEWHCPICWSDCDTDHSVSSWEDWYIKNVNLKCSIGTYSVTVYPKKNYVWADGTTAGKTLTWKILPIAKLAKPTKTGLRFSTSLVFNGYTRRVNGKSVDSRMTATGLKACAPGTYTATFKPKAGYLWSDGTSSAVKLTWRIAKAKASSLKALFPDGNGGATRAYARVKGRTGGEYVQLNLSMGSGKAFCAVAGKTAHDMGGYDGSIVRSVRYYGNGLPGTATVTIRLNKAFFAGDDPMVKKTFTILPANANGWVKSGGKWYYTGKCYDLAGKRTSVTPGRAPGGTGWKLIEGSWYFFSRDTYAMVTGLFRDNGKTYYCDSSGAMLGGCWKKVGKSWYYFGGSGAAYTGRHKIGGVWYMFDSRGRMV